MCVCGGVISILLLFSCCAASALQRRQSGRDGRCEVIENANT